MARKPKVYHAKIVELRLKLFELLKQNGEMYPAEIKRTMDPKKNDPSIYQNICLRLAEMRQCGILDMRVDNEQTAGRRRHFYSISHGWQTRNYDGRITDDIVNEIRNAPTLPSITEVGD